METNTCGRPRLMKKKGYIQLSRDSGYTKGIAFDILPSKKILALSVHEYIITSKMRAKNLPKKKCLQQETISS